MSSIELPFAVDPATLPANRLSAKACGNASYFTGKPCPQGHVAARWVANWTCVECNNVGARRWQKDNVEENRANARAYAKKYPERVSAANKVRYAKNVDKEHERALARYRANPEYAKENGRRWYAENKVRAKATTDAWRLANPDKVSANHHRRRARKASAQVESVSHEDIQNLKRKQKWCPDCGVRFSKTKVATLDHIVPLARGGAHSVANLELRCKSCNSRKNDRDPIDHARSLGRLL